MTNEKEMKDMFLNIKKYLKTKKDFNTICEELQLKDYELIGLVGLMKQNGELIDYVNGEIVTFKKPPKIDDVYEVGNNLSTLKLLLISDTHLCSKYDRLDILNYLYDKCDKEGVKHVLHAGDFTDGRSNRPEQVYELKVHSFQEQVEYCVEKYPEFNGRTYAIGGNHDGWWMKSAGSEIVKSIANKRDDIVYLGQDVGNMKIGKLKIRLFHGSGGIAYSKSYKIQKYLDQIPMNEKPHILQTGHIHQAFYYKQDMTHCFQTGCLEDLTPYARSLGFNGDKSAWWVNIDFDDKGNVYSVTPKIEEFKNKRMVKRK